VVTKENILTIREMTLKDLPTVLSIDRSSFPNPWPERSYRFELMDNPASRLLVCEAEIGGELRILGYVGCWHIVDELHISTIAVDPGFRRRGIGELLLQTVIRWGVVKGAQLVTLEVRESNRPALKLYQKYGFEQVGRRTGYYRDNDEDAILMSLDDVSNWELGLE
jgi:ribosomal-protein-alanine N-acetyltransferase